MAKDRSNGYEAVATHFSKCRGQAVNGIGTSTVRAWVRTIPQPATVLDLGCGTGIPISSMLMEEGMTVYGLDASPTMVKAYRQNFPTAPVVCEAAEESSLLSAISVPLKSEKSFC
ncbi:class I SAM-dependent methyltransferase [Nibrella viscosa]|uniref:class I SAM-dependent methyltransferase n=1 Tax=Nibrella viscosa TaxID=1084524 RepID=UPI00351AA8B6